MSQEEYDENRNYWKRLYVPPELAELFSVLANREGYGDDQEHLFIYKLLKHYNPEMVRTLSQILGAEWLDHPP